MTTGARFAECADLVKVGVPATTTGPSPVTRPLSPGNRAPIRVMRPGAFDYRDFPSLCGQTRVPFKSSITITDEAKQG